MDDYYTKRNSVYKTEGNVRIWFRKCNTLDAEKTPRGDCDPKDQSQYIIKSCHDPREIRGGGVFRRQNGLSLAEWFRLSSKEYQIKWLLFGDVKEPATKNITYRRLWRSPLQKWWQSMRSVVMVSTNVTQYLVLGAGCLCGNQFIILNATHFISR